MLKRNETIQGNLKMTRPVDENQAALLIESMSSQARLHIWGPIAQCDTPQVDKYHEENYRQANNHVQHWD